MDKKRVLVCCANGVATSTLVSVKVKKRLQSEGINADTKTCTTLEVKSLSKTFKPDLIISTAGINIGTDPSIPVVYGVSLVSRIDAEETWEQILGRLR